MITNNERFRYHFSSRKYIIQHTKNDNFTFFIQKGRKLSSCAKQWQIQKFVRGAMIREISGPVPRPSFLNSFNRGRGPGFRALNPLLACLVALVTNNFLLKFLRTFKAMSRRKITLDEKLIKIASEQMWKY